jgi:hypothetical protein
MQTTVASRFYIAPILFLAGWLFADFVFGQQQRIRRLAPGVLTVISTEEEPEETYTGPVPLVEVVEGIPNLNWTPHFDSKSDTLLEKARTTVLRRVIWNLEFAFKPMRMIVVDVPQPSGKMQRKLIWYMVYRVTNRGYALSPKPDTNRWGHTTHSIEKVNYDTRRLFPHIVLTSHEYSKEYVDRVIPAAQGPIQEREDPGVKLHNSVEITKIAIPLSSDRVERGVWGFATWEDVDPRIDFFSVYVGGLTNAYRFRDPAGAYKAGDPPGTGREYSFKRLRLNFWRPGDEVLEHEREFRFGIPLDEDRAAERETLDKYGLKRRLDYLWVYR